VKCPTKSTNHNIVLFVFSQPWESCWNQFLKNVCRMQCITYKVYFESIFKRNIIREIPILWSFRFELESLCGWFQWFKEPSRLLNYFTIIINAARARRTYHATPIFKISTVALAWRCYCSHCNFKMANKFSICKQCHLAQCSKIELLLT
jgi:hypothetical protein